MSVNISTSSLSVLTAVKFIVGFEKDHLSVRELFTEVFYRTMVAQTFLVVKDVSAQNRNNLSAFNKCLTFC